MSTWVRPGRNPTCCAEIDQAKSVARTKSAKKNEKRKQKKGGTGSDVSTAPRKQSDSIADQLEALRYVLKICL